MWRASERPFFTPGHHWACRKSAVPKAPANSFEYKQTFLRLLDDPQVQQKIVALLSRRLGQIRGE
jgi:hypothetical protein